MPLIAVVARRAFACGGRNLRPGDRVEVPPIEAVVLVHARKATFAKPLPARGAVAVVSHPVVDEWHAHNSRELLDALDQVHAPKKRSYKRRDLTPEPE